MATVRGRSRTQWWGVCLDARDPHGLAEFYAGILGWPVSQRDEHGAAIGVPGTSSYVSFQRNDAYAAPVWPGEPGRQQMMLHLDVAVDELEAAVADAIGRGAVRAAHQPQDDVCVLLDPEGHPFCLYYDAPEDDAPEG